MPGVAVEFYSKPLSFLGRFPGSSLECHLGHPHLPCQGRVSAMGPLVPPCEAPIARREELSNMGVHQNPHWGR